MIWKVDKGKSNLIVYVNFTDPSDNKVAEQRETYPIEVVHTNLKRLPDTIELRAEYMI